MIQKIKEIIFILGSFIAFAIMFTIIPVIFEIQNNRGCTFETLSCLDFVLRKDIRFDLVFIMIIYLIIYFYFAIKEIGGEIND